MNMDKHYCICIGRKFGSGGRNVAKLVADRLGIRVYDRDLLKTASESSGFSESFFDEADEEKTRKGLRSLFMNHLTGSGLTNNYLSNESIFKMQSEATLISGSNSPVRIRMVNMFTNARSISASVIKPCIRMLPIRALAAPRAAITPA